MVGGHTHDPADRTVGGIRVLNPGSLGLPHSPGRASWLLIDDTGASATVHHQTSGFDVADVVAALERRRHPNRSFVTIVLTTGTFVQSSRPGPT